jgi:hypothetical protein
MNDIALLQMSMDEQRELIRPLGAVWRIRPKAMERPARPASATAPAWYTN